MRARDLDWFCLTCARHVSSFPRFSFLVSHFSFPISHFPVPSFISTRQAGSAECDPPPAVAHAHLRLTQPTSQTLSRDHLPSVPEPQQAKHNFVSHPNCLPWVVHTKSLLLNCAHDLRITSLCLLSCLFLADLALGTDHKPMACRTNPLPPKKLNSCILPFRR